MANIDPNKLVKNLEVVTATEGELRLYWDLPTDLVDGEEIVVTRRKDAFPVEIKNRNFEDRYTDVAQVEVFRGSPIYCSHLIPNGSGILQAAGDNVFAPVMAEFERSNKYTGRLVRDSLSQVFMITGNNDTELFYESISQNPDNQVTPVEGAFVILADFPKVRQPIKTIPLLSNAFTLSIVTNSFTAGDTITLNNTVNLVYGVDWSAGATALDTAQNLKLAISNSGVGYLVSSYDETLLIERGTETTLAVESSNPNAEVVDHAASRGKIFVEPDILKASEVRNLVIQDGDVQFSFVKSNTTKCIKLQTQVIVPDTNVNALDSFNNTFLIGFKDNYKSGSEALLKSGSGLETDVFYYYTAFTTPLTSISITYNENDLGGENPLPYTIDKLAPYYVRISYESIKYVNSDAGEYTYDPVTGEIAFVDGRDLSSEDILVGYLFADSLGMRFSITDVTDLALGKFKLAPALSIGVDNVSKLHGSVVVADTPIGFSSTSVGDTFKDIAGNSYQIYGTNSDPLAGISVPPSHSFDIGQGLIDKNIMLNQFLVPYSYDPSNGRIQYGERVITENKQLSPFTYDSGTGIVTYTTNIELGEVVSNQYFVDGAGNTFKIANVNPALLQVTLDTGLTVDNTVNTRRDGSIFDLEGFKDVDGTSLLDLDKAAKLDLFKTNSKADYVITGVDAANGRIYISTGLDSLSVIMETEFDGSIYRRGADVSWVGFDNENSSVLNSSNLGAVRRYNSVNDVQFAYFSNGLSTQSFAVSAKDNNLSAMMYKWWPSIFKDLDDSGDLEDLMSVFGQKFNEIYSLISLHELQNASVLTPKSLALSATQSGLQELSETLGIDTRRRIVQDLISCWKLKGNREGIAKFIKVITTWDVTNGTGDVIRAITDATPDTTGLRHYSTSLGTLNTNIIDTADVQSPPAGRFVKGIPGLNLSGFFDQVEIQIELPNVALYTGISSNLSYVGGNTLIGDTTANFGQINSLIGCILIPIEGNPNDYVEILSNTVDTLTVSGQVPFSALGNKYVILSPLNLNRFVALQSTIAEQLPYNAVPVFNFTIKTI